MSSAKLRAPAHVLSQMPRARRHDPAVAEASLSGLSHRRPPGRCAEGEGTRDSAGQRAPPPAHRQVSRASLPRPSSRGDQGRTDAAARGRDAVARCRGHFAHDWMRAGQLVTAFVRGRHFQEALSEAVELVGGGAQVLVAARPVADDAHLFVHTRMQRSWPSSFFAASDMIAPSPRLSTTRLNDARKEAHGVAGPARKGSPKRRRCASLASFLWRFARTAASAFGAFHCHEQNRRRLN